MRRIEKLLMVLIATIVLTAVVFIVTNYEPTTHCVFGLHDKKAQWHAVDVSRSWGAVEVGLPNGGQIILQDAVVLPSEACPARKDH
jgi:hypothetical protein